MLICGTKLGSYEIASQLGAGGMGEVYQARDSKLGREVDIVALDDALKRLAGLDPRQSRIIELRFFGGLSIEETAMVLGLSPAMVKREWTTARAWLHREIQKGVRE